MEDHQKAGLAAFEEVQNEVEDKLFKPRMEPALRAYLTKLRVNAFLEIKPGYEDSGAAPGKNTAWEDPARAQAGNGDQGRSRRADTHNEAAGMIPIPGTSTQCDRDFFFALNATAATRNEVSLYLRAGAEPDHQRTFPGPAQGCSPEEIGRAVSFADAGRSHRRAGRQDVGQRRPKCWTLSSATISCASRACCRFFRTGRSSPCTRLQPVADSEVDFADYFPASKRDRDEMFRELQRLDRVDRPIRILKALLEAIFADEAIALAFRTAPAAKSVHHAWLGGLIEHVLSLCHLAKFTAAHYPDIDFDLLLAGVILHDIGKIRELTYARSFGYTTEGQLLGHIVIGVRMVEDKLRQVPGFPRPAAGSAAAHDPEPSWRAGIRIAQGADVRRGDAAASSGQSGFEDGDACAAWWSATAWWKACGPATAPRSIAACSRSGSIWTRPRAAGGRPAGDSSIRLGCSPNSRCHKTRGHGSPDYESVRKPGPRPVVAIRREVEGGSYP